MRIKRILERIVLSGALALAGCQSNLKTDSQRNEQYLGVISGDFNGDGERDIAFVRINKRDIEAHARNNSLKYVLQSGNPEIDWDKAYSGNNYLQLVIIDNDKNETDTKVLEKYLMDFAGSNFDK